MLDPVGAYQALKPEIDQCIQEVLTSGQYVLGKNVAALERKVAQFVGTSHAVAVASGTDALHLALVATGIGPGDEVITTPFTFAATVEAIHNVGARAVFVDIDPDTFNIDASQIEQAITPLTRAIMPVHLFGLAADMMRIADIAQRHELEIIEDCAQSMGSHIDGKVTGSFGLAGTFSFYPSKTLGCFGDGGMVTTNSGHVAERLRMLRNHGYGESYRHEMVGFNSRLDEIQAAILRVKLPHLEINNARRRAIAAHYNELLAATPAVTPAEPDDGGHVYGYYTIRVPRRDELRASLGEAGVATAVYYPLPLHRQECFAPSCRYGSLPVAEQISEECLSLPIFPEMSDAQCERVAQLVADTIRPW